MESRIRVQKSSAGSYRNGEARAELNSDVAKCRQAGVRGFPTISLSYDGKSVVLSGYIPFDRLMPVLSDLTDGQFALRHVAATEAGVFDFITRYRRVAFGEIVSTFDISEHEADSLVDALVKDGKIQREDRGSSCFLRPSVQG